MQNIYFAKLYFLKEVILLRNELPSAVILVSANISSACPPSSRVSPICHTAKPYGQGHTRLSHIKRRRLIMSLVTLVQKDHSAPATSYFRLVLGAPFLVAAAPRVPSSLIVSASIITLRTSKFRVKVNKKSTPLGVLYGACPRTRPP